MLRVKLTLWYVGLLAAILAAFSIGFYSLLGKSLSQRLDAGLRSAAQVTALTLNHETEEHSGKRDGEESVRMVLNSMHQTSFPRANLSIWEGDRLVAEKPGIAGLDAKRARGMVTPGKAYDFSTVYTDREHYRVVQLPTYVPASKTQYLVVASESAEAIEAELRTVAEILAIIVPVCLIAAAAGGYLLARKSLAPVKEMAEAAEQISSRNLTQRLPLGNPKDELGLLAQTFNRLFGRLHDSFEQQRRFMADASHELRTPISVALTATQVSLSNRATPPEALFETLEVVQSQMLRLRRVVEDMFILAQADSGSYAPSFSPFYLDEVLVESARAGRVLGEAKGVDVNLAAPKQGLEANGDEGLVRQLLLILIDNAIKYTPAGGRVDVELEAATSGYRIRVRDTGCGIPASEQPHIFDRFYRVDKSRSRRNPGAGSGAGLGLSIARWIAGIHRGTVALEDSTPQGSVFTVVLPV
ncbi:two-component sensor histidine kinase [Bryobacterales bacterium F-183]|nr:two-component sensor histidine kinase [Bryobacterales bacterium F-183]